jgi:hypothetical protein
VAATSGSSGASLASPVASVALEAASVVVGAPVGHHITVVHPTLSLVSPVNFLPLAGSSLLLLRGSGAAWLRIRILSRHVDTFEVGVADGIHHVLGKLVVAEASHMHRPNRPELLDPLRSGFVGIPVIHERIWVENSVVADSLQVGLVVHPLLNLRQGISLRPHVPLSVGAVGGVVAATLHDVPHDG